MRGAGASDEAVMIFRTRYLPGVTNAHRVLFRGQALNIREVVEIDRREMELRTVTIAGAV